MAAGPFLKGAREHLLLLSKRLGRDQATIAARDARIADFEALIADYRQQIAALITGAALPNASGSRRARAKTASTAGNQKSTPTSSALATQPRAKRNAGKTTKSAARLRSPSKIHDRTKR